MYTASQAFLVLRRYLLFSILLPSLYVTICTVLITTNRFYYTKDILKKNEGKFVTLDVKPEYDIDKINNGLYR